MGWPMAAATILQRPLAPAVASDDVRPAPAGSGARADRWRRRGAGVRAGAGDGPSDSRLMATEVVEVEGHIIDSLILAKVLDAIIEAGADYRMVDVEIGRTNVDTSRARIEITADDEDVLGTLVATLQLHGANRDGGEAAVLAAPASAGV